MICIDKSIQDILSIIYAFCVESNLYEQQVINASKRAEHSYIIILINNRNVVNHVLLISCY